MKIFIGIYMLAGGRELEQEPFDFSMDSAWLVQVATALRSEGAKPIDRGNRTTVLRFSVRRNHLSALQATEFLLLHASGLVHAGGDVVLVSEGPSSQSYFMGDWAVRHIRGTQEGCSTIHNYEIIGGPLAPAPTKEN